MRRRLLSPNWQRERVAEDGYQQPYCVFSVRRGGGYEMDCDAEVSQKWRMRVSGEAIVRHSATARGLPLPCMRIALA
jgi:hypothetical protein